MSLRSTSSSSSSDEQERSSSYSTDATSVLSANEVAQENNADGSNDGVDRQQLGHEGGFGGQEDLEDRYASTSGDN